MKLSVFVAVLLPTVAAFVVPSGVPPTSPSNTLAGGAGIASIRTRAVAVAAAPGSVGPLSYKGDPTWSVSSFWKEMVGSASDTKAKVDSTVSEH